MPPTLDDLPDLRSGAERRLGVPVSTIEPARVGDRGLTDSLRGFTLRSRDNSSMPKRRPPRRRLQSARRTRKDLESLDLFALLDNPAARSAITSEERLSASVEEYRRHVSEAAKNPIVLHGWRTEATFAGLVTALGTVQFLKHEDRGSMFVDGTDAATAPDFRLRTADGEVWLVEVKNHHPKSDPTRAFSIKRSYLKKLERYAELSGTPTLKFAIFWSWWDTWTLIDPSVFGDTKSPSMLEVSMPRAVMASEMASVGDVTIGTEAPLTLSFLSDPASPRRVDGEGHAEFTIGVVELTCTGRKITDKTEESLGGRCFSGEYSDCSCFAV